MHRSWDQPIRHRFREPLPQAFLSSRMATKVECRKCPASVHSTKAIWQTSFGLIHRHFSIFSAVSDSPHREALFSGKFLKGILRNLQRLERREEFISNSRHKPVLDLRDELELLVLVNANQQRIESARSRDVAPDGDSLGLQPPFRRIVLCFLERKVPSRAVISYTGPLSAPTSLRPQSG